MTAPDLWRIFSGHYRLDAPQAPRIRHQQMQEADDGTMQILHWADEIEARGAKITAIGTAETGLPEARLEGERGRTTGQLRLFAEVLRDGDYLDRRHDEALPNRQPLPRPFAAV